ncbi:MAG: DUF1800 family protein [Pseudomonadales bacterium]
MQPHSAIRALTILFLATIGFASTDCLAAESLSGSAFDGGTRAAARFENLAPLPKSEWNARLAAHLAERAGFGATPGQVEALAKRSPSGAVRSFTRARLQTKPLFDHSGVFDSGLEDFPPSRPATTNRAKHDGAAIGIKVKAGGNRPIQPVVNQFFYWLRASRLETDRVAYWWANRMLTTTHPLQEKMALFWHGHFATNEDKVRDYRKMLQQVELFQQYGLGDFRVLLDAVAKSPAMLAFLDAGVNVKGSPNENFAREIMELFTMGVGHYREQDIREAARAFTGWNFDGTAFAFNADQFDAGRKTFLGQTGRFTGEEIMQMILEQPSTARFIASKLYRFLVREELSEAFAGQLGKLLLDVDYDIQKYVERLLLSQDFYASVSIASRIKSPVELVISTYHRLGLEQVPGVPDFNQLTEALGQRLLHPPTVAGWSYGQSWLTPSLLFERGNFVLDVMFPDIGFVPPDRYPNYGGSEIVQVQKRLRQGQTISEATKPTGSAGTTMAASNQLADRDEDFNTRYGSYRGWQMALERVKPIPRHTARLQLAQSVIAARIATPEQVVALFERRFFAAELAGPTRTELANFLEQQLGTRDIQSASTYLEEPLRTLLHLMLSLPEYQLG